MNSGNFHKEVEYKSEFVLPDILFRFRVAQSSLKMSWVLGNWLKKCRVGSSMICWEIGVCKVSWEIVLGMKLAFVKFLKVFLAISQMILSRILSRYYLGYYLRILSGILFWKLSGYYLRYFPDSTRDTVWIVPGVLSG